MDNITLRYPGNLTSKSVKIKTANPGRRFLVFDQEKLALMLANTPLS